MEKSTDKTSQQSSNQDYIEVYGARVHNLNSIDIKIPRDKLVVLTGLSGSGKSSLAFDTIYAEGQRRYLETFNTYARQFIGNMERPDVDEIKGLSPVISIEQKSTNKNPRSTVGTITEVYDFLRLLYARASTAYSYESGEKMVKYTDQQIVKRIFQDFDQKKILVLAPMIKGRKGHYRELFQKIQRLGYVSVRVDGELLDVHPGMQLDRYKIHDIEVVVDKLKVDEKYNQRLKKSIETAIKLSKGGLIIFNIEDEAYRFFSKKLMCPTTGMAYDEPEPNTFSFNSPYGACRKCNGLGTVSEIDIDKIFPDKNISIRKGGVSPIGEYKSSWIFNQLEGIGKKYDFTLDSPISELSNEAIDVILYGSNESIQVYKETLGVTSNYTINFEGIVNFIEQQGKESSSESVRRWAAGFMNHVDCPVCNGDRLRKESLWFKMDDKNIAELSRMDIIQLNDWLDRFDSSNDDRRAKIAKEILREVKTRLKFLLDVGLGYLSLNRSARSLSGGEAQRIRLATQIGSQLQGVLYILDEPSIGLHQRDNNRLIKSLKELRDVGNSVMVVEHDEDMMRSADMVIDMGPGAGVHGGQIVAQGSPGEMLECKTLTCEYLSGARKIEIPRQRRKGNGLFIELKGAKGNNLQNVNLKLPLGKLVCITGVSGSGKSTLINETLYPLLSQYFYNSVKKPLAYKSIEGIKNIDKIIDIDQSPIGRTPRSNPATYTKVFDEIRKLFVMVPEAKIRGYKPGRFSFNVKGGRCETCKGAGVKLVEMNFLPDVMVECEECQGKRYNRETLEIRYKGKSINDVLNMTIEQGKEFFENIPKIQSKLKTLDDVGLGYVTLGQQSTTLSGGEAQRVKLASELAKKSTGKTMYILDEPTTGLHFEDVRVLMEVINKLVNKGNTVLIIEHNLEVVKMADHIVDLGPEGGRGGGKILVEGTPEEIIHHKSSFTAQYLKDILEKGAATK
jgi:excinuclease ABC subunit A